MLLQRTTVSGGVQHDWVLRSLSACICRCGKSAVEVTGPHSPAEQHVNYEIEVGYVKVGKRPASGQKENVSHVSCPDMWLHNILC